MTRIRSCLAFLLLIALVCGTAQAVTYDVTNLGNLGGTSPDVWSNIAWSINGSGEAVGSSRTASGADHAYLYNGSTMIDLGTLGGKNSEADFINDSGLVLGNADITGNGATPCFSLRRLGHDRSRHSRWKRQPAFSINAAGQIFGWSQLPGNAAGHAFIYSGSTMKDIGTLGGANSAAGDINASGLAVGWADITGNTERHAYLYNGSTMTDLLTLGGTYSAAWAINASGQCVGTSTIARNTAEHGVLFNGSKLIDLGTLGGSYCSANDINDSGQIVGESFIANSETIHACIYNGSKMIDLNGLIDPHSGWILQSATSINNAGQIVGSGDYQGQSCSFLLTPVPEPSSFASLGVCAAGLMAFVWRKRRGAKVLNNRPWKGEST